MFKYRSTSIIIDLRFLFGSVFSILSLALMLFVFPPIEHSTPFVLFSFLVGFVGYYLGCFIHVILVDFMLEHTVWKDDLN
jgi:hypothetical protein